MSLTLILVIVVVVVALTFDFCNGFNDAANAIATIVVSKTLNPGQAVILAACSNFAGCFIFGTAVANMIGHGVVHVEHVTLTLLLATLVGAIVWDIIAWYFGLPTSSSHALIGGLLGSGIVVAGLKVVIWHGVLKIFSFIFLAPIIGMTGAILITTLTMWIFRKSHPSKTGGIFKKLQLVAATAVSVGHGTNDAQKTMGLIALALCTAHYSDSFLTGKIDTWIKLSAYSMISLGTICGGWRIVKTMGTRITRIREMEGFCANASASLVLFGCSIGGIPVSTTHVLAGSIMGVGTVEHVKMVRWITARNILWAWIVTIPCSAAIAAGSYLILSQFLPK
jgi:inorganic phosphate transporter, PiT family